MEEFIYKGKIIGWRMRKMPNGSIPATPGEEPLQVVTLKHKAGSYLKAHKHLPKSRKTESLQECLFVKKGKVKLDLYGEDNICFKKVLLKEGDFFLSVGGGIGIHIIDDAEMFEVKNGPFVEDKVLI